MEKEQEVADTEKKEDKPKTELEEAQDNVKMYHDKWIEAHNKLVDIKRILEGETLPQAQKAEIPQTQKEETEETKEE